MRCTRADVEVKRYGTLEARRWRRDVEVFASRALELRKHAVGVEMRRYGGMETGCKRADVVTQRYEALELCSQIVWMWRCLPQEIGGSEVRCRRAGVE